MNRRAMLLSVLALAMMGLAVALLATHHQWVRLGPPGVRVAAKPIYTLSRTNPTAPPYLAGTNLVELPEKVLDYTSQAELVNEWALEILPQDTTFGHRTYARTNEPPLRLQSVLMGTDRTSIHTPQFCLPGAGFQIIATTSSHVPVKSPHPYDLPVMRLDLRGKVVDEKGESRTEGGVFVYWFVADGQLTSSHLDRTWSIIRDVVKTRVMKRWAYVMCSTSCPTGHEDEAFERIKEFIAAAVPQFQLTTGPEEKRR